MASEKWLLAVCFVFAWTSNMPHSKQTLIFGFLATGGSSGFNMLVIASSDSWRYGILAFDSFLLFGSLFCFDLPTVLQHQMVSPYDVINTNGTNATSLNHTTDCKVCLGLGEVRYNLLHSSMRWTSAILCLPLGYFIDRLGNSRSAILLATLSCLGSVLFAVGAVSRTPTTPPFYLLMITGRIFLAFGEGPLRIVQDRVIAHWFSADSYVPLAFLLLGRRGGSLLNFLITANIAESVGFGLAVWLGAILTGFSAICAVGLGLLIYLGNKDQEESTRGRMMSKAVTLHDLRVIPSKFWLHVVMIAIAYGAYFSFVANVTNYLQLRYGYTMVDASYITGATQVAAIFAPCIAAILKRIDCNGLVVTCFIAIMIPVYVCLCVCPSIHPVILTAVLGVTHCVIALVLWQVAVIVSPASCFGTVAGIVFLVRNFSIALILFCMGYVLQGSDGYVDDASQIQRYNSFFLALVAITSVSVLCGVVLNVLDLRGNCVINQRIGRWKKPNGEEIALISTEKQCDGYISTESTSG